MEKERKSKSNCFQLNLAGEISRIPHCERLPERARWRYRITRLVPEENIVLFLFINSFIYQACSIKNAAYWPRYFLRVYGPQRHLGL